MVASEYPNFEIILADNASTDDTTSWIKDNYPDVTVVTHPENWGFSRGNNEAIRHAQGEYIVLLNNDVEVAPDWLDPLVDELENHPDAAAVQPKLLQFIDRTRFEYAGGSGGFLDRFGYPFTRGRLFFTLEPDEGQYDEARDVFWATGAAMMIRKTALDRVGLLDESFFMHMEEIDLCWRLQRNGYRIRVAPASVVYHIGGASLPQGNAQKTYYNFRNSLLILYKNLTPKEWRTTFVQRIMLDCIAMMRALFTGQFKEFGAMVKAYNDAHRMKKAYSDTRPIESQKLAIPLHRRSIVFDYFLRGRKRYQDL